MQDESSTKSGVTQPAPVSPELGTTSTIHEIQNGSKDFIEIGEIQVVRHLQERITIGLTLRRTARNISRLKGICAVIPSAYLGKRLTPDFVLLSISITSCCCQHPHHLYKPLPLEISYAVPPALDQLRQPLVGFLQAEAIRLQRTVLF
jgi:hypothetical protein